MKIIYKITYPNGKIYIGGIKTLGAYDLYAMLPLEDFNEYFTLDQKLHDIIGIEKLETYLISPFGKWPANLFQSLL